MDQKPEPTEGEIRLRAYHIWQWLGCPEGYEDELWLRAERELKAGRSAEGTRAGGEVPMSGGGSDGPG